MNDKRKVKRSAHKIAREVRKMLFTASASASTSTLMINSQPLHYTSTRFHSLQLDKVNRQILHNQDRLRRSIEAIEETIAASNAAKARLSQIVVAQDPPDDDDEDEGLALRSPPKIRGLRIKELVQSFEIKHVIDGIVDSDNTTPPQASYPPMVNLSHESVSLFTNCSEIIPLPPSSSESESYSEFDQPRTDVKVARSRGDSSTVSSCSSSSVLTTSTSSSSKTFELPAEVKILSQSPKKDDGENLVPALRQLSRMIEGILEGNGGGSGKQLFDANDHDAEERREQVLILESRRLITNVEVEMKRQQQQPLYVAPPPPYDPSKYVDNPLTLSDVVPHFAEKRRRMREENSKHTVHHNSANAPQQQQQAKTTKKVAQKG